MPDEKQPTEALKAALDESALAVLKLTADLKYIQGIVERGEGRTLAADEPITLAALNYVKVLEAIPTWLCDECRNQWIVGRTPLAALKGARP